MRLARTFGVLNRKCWIDLRLQRTYLCPRGHCFQFELSQLMVVSRRLFLIQQSNGQDMAKWTTFGPEGLFPVKHDNLVGTC